MAIMSQREGLEFEGAIESDCASLNTPGRRHARDPIRQPDFLHCLRDPTRGGAATTLNEIAKRANVGMLLREQSIPVRESVRGACEVLGLDPLYVANEGKLLAVVRTGYGGSRPARRCARIRLATTPPSSARSSPTIPAWC